MVIYLVKGTLTKGILKIVSTELEVKETEKTFKIISDKTGIGYRSVINKEKELGTISDTLYLNNHRFISFETYCLVDNLETAKIDILDKIENEYNKIKKEFGELVSTIENNKVEYIKR